MKRIILCLDGTWNSAYNKSKRDDGSQVVKPSNVLKLARALSPMDAKANHQIVYYDTGVGSLSKYPGFSNRVLSQIDHYFGGAWGAGFEANIEDALTFLVNNYQAKKGNKKADEVFVFGFSRGAATARALTQVIDWMGGIPNKADAFFLPKLFRGFIRSKGKSTFDEVKQRIFDGIDLVNAKRERKIPYPFKNWQPVRIKFLGVWDTVLALGGRVINMKSRMFYLNEYPADCIDHVRQALAIDEQRYDFLPEVWQAPSTQNESLKQMWFAGVHSNVGGGYTHDGLANITLHWMVKELKDAVSDIKFNENFLKKYRPYLQDELIESKTRTYKVKDFILRQKGLRKIVTDLDDGYEQSGLRINFNALQRLLVDANDKQHKHFTLYQPKNLIAYIKKVGIDQILKEELAEVDSTLKQYKDKTELTRPEKTTVNKAKQRKQVIQSLLALDL